MKAKDLAKFLYEDSRKILVPDDGEGSFFEDTNKEHQKKLIFLAERLIQFINEKQNFPLEIIKAAIRLCDHRLYCLKKYHTIEFPKESILVMKDLLNGKKNLDDFNAWLDSCKEDQVK